jgi:hypothetical protein
MDPQAIYPDNLRTIQNGKDEDGKEIEHVLEGTNRYALGII